MVASRSPARSVAVDVRGWLGGVRFSAFTGIMFGLVVLAVFVLVPTVSTFVAQKQEIAALRESVRASREQVAALELQRERHSDPAYITTQARERLYYVKPGEVVYLVDNDLSPAEQPRDVQKVTTDVVQTPSDWMTNMLRSVVTTGTARPVTVADVPTPTPSPKPSATPSPKK